MLETPLTERHKEDMITKILLGIVEANTPNNLIRYLLHIRLDLREMIPLDLAHDPGLLLEMCFNHYKVDGEIDMNRATQDLANYQQGENSFTADVAVPVDIKLSALSPDTKNMRAAIPIALAKLFSDPAQFEKDVTLNRLSSALLNVRDTETGKLLSAVTFDAPATDVIVSVGEIAVLGEVTIL